jgi:flagellar protein FlaG
MNNDISAINTAKAAVPTAAHVPAPAPAAAAATAAALPANAAAAEEKQPAPEPKFEPLVSKEEQRENLRSAIQRLNDMMKESSRDLNFSMDETTDRVVITVKNANTGEVVRQIPDATFLRVSHNLENLKGVLLNKST